MRSTSISIFILFLVLITTPAFAQVFVNLPDTSAFPDDTLRVPVNVADLTALDIYSYQFKIKYDSTVVKAVGVDSTKTLTEQWGTTWINLEVSEEIAVGNYGVDPLQDSGVLIYVLFEMIGEVDDSTQVVFQNIEFNAGQPPTIATNGSIKILHPPVSVLFNTNIAVKIQIMIDGIEKNLPFDTTWVYGSTHIIGASSPQYRTTDIRYGFNSWSDGGDTLHSVIPISDTTFTLNMNEEYLLTVKSEYGTIQGAGWYVKGTTANFSVDSLTQDNDSTRHIFYKWNGTGNSSYTGNQRTGSIIMNDPVTEIAEWKLQYYLKIESLYGNPVGQGWHDQGDTVVIGIDSLVSAVEGTRYIFDSWIGNGQASYSGNKRGAEVVVLEPLTEKALWQTEHYLWIKSNPEEIIHFEQSGWYSKNQTAITDTAKQILNLPDVIYHFQSWSVDGQAVAKNPTQILMDTSHIAEALYQIDSVLVTITTNIGAGTSIYVDGVNYPVPYSRFWTFQSEHTISIDTVQIAPDLKTRYLFESWSDHGEQSHVVKADTVLQLAAFLSTQHFLLVDTHPSGLIDFKETGWYDQSDTVDLPEVPAQVIVGQDTFNFKGWHFDNLPVSGTTNQIIMDSYHSAIALYKDLFFIKGQIMDRRGNHVPEIEVILSGTSHDTVKVSSDNEYCFNFLTQGNYRVAPHLDGFQFEPPYQVYASLQSSFSQQNFFAIDTLKPDVRLIYPNGEEQLQGATTDTIIWQAEDNMGIDSIVIDFSIDNGTTWQTIAKLNANGESNHIWTIPDVSSSQCKIRVRAIDFDWNQAFDVSDSPFSIMSPSVVGDDLTENIPSTFEVQQNYPNPFNSSTIIRFQIPEASTVRIKIFNMMGQDIVTLVDRKINAGNHYVSWDAKDRSGKLVSSGVYFCHVEASSKVIIRRLLYIR